MSPTGIGLIVFVVLLSGAIAYWGDVVGRKLGKKRLSLGRKIRPRHTAAIMTALFGTLGSAAAIVVLMLVSTPVRRMLIEGDQLRLENATLQQENRDAKKELAGVNDKLKEATSQVNSTKGQLQVEQGKLRSAQREVDRLNKLASGLTSQLKAIRGQLALVNRQLSALKPQYLALKAEYTKIQGDKTSAEKQLHETSKQLAEISFQNLQISQQIRDSEAKRELLAGEMTDLQKTIKDLQVQLEDQTKEAKKKLEEVQGKIDEANSQLKSARQEYNDADSKLQTLLKGPLTVSRTQPLTYVRGEELARMAVGSRLSAAEARNYILAVLQSASSNAVDKGAQAPKGSQRAVLWQEFDDNRQPIPEETEIQKLSLAMGGKREEQVLIARAGFNSFRGEPVYIVIETHANPVVYAQGAVIGETRIDGQLAEDQILQAISNYVREKLAPKAVEDGIIPAIGYPEPLGEIPLTDLLNLVKQIKSTNRPIRIQFLAATETRAADHLKLEFRLR